MAVCEKHCMHGLAMGRFKAVASISGGLFFSSNTGVMGARCLKHMVGLSQCIHNVCDQ